MTDIEVIKKNIASLIEKLGADSKERIDLENAVEAAIALTRTMNPLKAKVYLDDLKKAFEPINNANPISVSLFAQRQELATESQVRLDALAMVFNIITEFLFRLSCLLFLITTQEMKEAFISNKIDQFWDAFLGDGLVNAIKKRFEYDISESIWDLLVLGKTNNHRAALTIYEAVIVFFQALTNQNAPPLSYDGWSSDDDSLTDISEDEDSEAFSLKYR